MLSLRALRLLVVALALLVVLALLLSWMSWRKVRHLQEPLVLRVEEARLQSQQAHDLGQQLERQTQEYGTQLAALRGRTRNLEAFQQKTQEMAQALLRAQDQNLPIELEANLRSALEQAELTGMIEPLLAALTSSERRLMRIHDPRLLTVQQAIGQDLERVRKAQVPDTEALLTQIDQLQQRVDQLPMQGGTPLEPEEFFDQLPRSPEQGWQRLLQRLVTHGKNWIRVSRLDTSDAVIMDAHQRFLVRESLKLYLQAARLSLLARQYEISRQELEAAQRLMKRWFDGQSRRNILAMQELKNIAQAINAPQMPSIFESLHALENAIAQAHAAEQKGR